jgi:hypothetical protein
MSTSDNDHSALTFTPTLSQLVSQITPENRYAEISVGAEIGMEVVDTVDTKS